MLGNIHSTICTRDGEDDGIDVDTKEGGDHNIIENEGINRLIYDTFVSMDENIH